jgi:hypothetical protein
MRDYVVQSPIYQANPAPPVSSLVSDSGNLVERLQSLYGHLTQLGEKLHGSRPRDASAGGGKIEPEPTLRRNIDKASICLKDIEGELEYISARL